jgi:hypothetical protein
MGFYIRKSVRVGPLRFNLSKSGVGVSAGVRGFRVGTGPRGHYVHAGAGGFYYRASLGAKSPAPTMEQRTRLLGPTPVIDPTVGPSMTVSAGSAMEMSDGSSADLLAEMRGKHRRLRSWPWAAGLTAVGFFMYGQDLPAWASTLWVVLGLAVTAAALHWDTMRKTTVLMYDFDSPATARFEELLAGFSGLAAARRLWRVETTAAVFNSKYHAGAGSILGRAAARVGTSLPPYVKCNIDVPVITLGRRRLYFFPDRVLVYDLMSVGAVSYADLRMNRTSTQFIESQGVPQDAKVIRHTWKYVNKNGGPDRRFNGNRQIPVALYEEVQLRSGSGLGEVLHVSKLGAAEPLEAWLRRHARGVEASVR